MRRKGHMGTQLGVSKYMLLLFIYCKDLSFDASCTHPHIKQPHEPAASLRSSYSNLSG